MSASVARRILDERKGYLRHSCFGDCCLTAVEKRTLIRALKKHAKPKRRKEHPPRA